MECVKRSNVVALGLKRGQGVVLNMNVIPAPQVGMRTKYRQHHIKI